MQRPSYVPMTAYFPFWQKFAAVISRVWPSTSFHNATFLSGMFHSLSFPSREPLRKYLSSCKVGKKAVSLTVNSAMTVSLCLTGAEGVTGVM